MFAQGCVGGSLLAAAAATAGAAAMFAQGCVGGSFVAAAAEAWRLHCVIKGRSGSSSHLFVVGKTWVQLLPVVVVSCSCALQITTVIGGMEQQQQAQAIKRKPHVVVATPGRLAALLETDSGLAAGTITAQLAPVGAEGGGAVGGGWAWHGQGNRCMRRWRHRGHCQPCCRRTAAQQQVHIHLVVYVGVKCTWREGGRGGVLGGDGVVGPHHTVPPQGSSCCCCCCLVVATPGSTAGQTMTQQQVHTVAGGCMTGGGSCKSQGGTTCSPKQQCFLDR
jgi:hypothetical protein